MQNTLGSGLVDLLDGDADGGFLILLGILESDEGFSILRRLPTDTDSLKDTYFDSLLQNAAENAAVETADTYKKLETGSFYEKLRDMRETSRNPNLRDKLPMQYVTKSILSLFITSAF